MTRRNTIIISVLINAGLLSVLFMSAFNSKQNKIEPSAREMAQAIDEMAIDAKNLYTAAADIDKTAPISDNIEIVPVLKEEEPLFTEPKEEMKTEPSQIASNPIMHELPNLAKVEEKLPVFEEKTQIDTLPVVVKKGDTLDKIARHYNATVADIVRINNLSSSFLRIGQTLQIPRNTILAKKQTAVKTQHIKTDSQFYIVKVGDNPYTIAMKHNLKLSELLKMNNLDEKKARKLKPGAKLRIR